MEENDGKKPLITVVDDMIGNLKIVGKILLNAGYEVAMTQDSKKAVEMIEANPPNLILLDIMMPFVDGYQVCEQIKSKEHLKDIPVIFFTAKGETSDLVRGFEVGGVDYIVKPASKEELIARIKTHLELKKSKDLIDKQKKEIETLFKEKNQFFNIAIKNIIRPLEQVAEKANYLKKMKAYISDKEFEDNLDWIVSDSRNAYKTLVDLYDVNYLDYKEDISEVELSKFNFDDLVKDIIVDYENDIKRKRLIIKFNENENEDIGLELNIVEDDKIMYNDKQSVRQIIDNLISNAIKYSPFYKTVNILSETQHAGETELIKFIVKDEGPGIPKEQQKYLFNKFAQIDTPTTGKEPSSGLGLYIVKRLVERLGGKVSAISDKDKGAAFIVLLPKKHPKAKE